MEALSYSVKLLSLITCPCFFMTCSTFSHLVLFLYFWRLHLLVCLCSFCPSLCIIAKTLHMSDNIAISFTYHNINERLIFFQCVKLYRWCTAVSVTFRYDELGRKCRMRPQRECNIFNRVHRIWMLHEQPCFICFVVWPTKQIWNYNILLVLKYLW